MYQVETEAQSLRSKGCLVLVLDVNHRGQTITTCLSTALDHGRPAATGSLSENCQCPIRSWSCVWTWSSLFSRSSFSRWSWGLVAWWTWSQVCCWLFWRRRLEDLW